jgi:F5/8 type C domain
MKLNFSAAMGSACVVAGGFSLFFSACSSATTPSPGNQADASGSSGSGSSSGGSSGTGNSSGGNSSGSSSGAGSSGSSSGSGSGAGSSSSSSSSGGAEAGLDGSSNDSSVADVVVADVARTDAGALVRTGWTAVAMPDHVPANMTNPPSTESLVTGNAFDGMNGTRWATGVFQSTLTFPLYFTVDMKAVTTVSRITLYAGSQDINDYPAMMDVSFSTDGTNFTTVVTGHAPAPPASGIDPITIPATAPPAQFIKLTATMKHDTTNQHWWWAIGEMNVYP